MLYTAVEKLYSKVSEQIQPHTSNYATLTIYTKIFVNREPLCFSKGCKNDTEIILSDQHCSTTDNHLQFIMNIHLVQNYIYTVHVIFADVSRLKHGLFLLALTKSCGISRK